MLRIKLAVGALCVTAIVGACTDDGVAPRALVAPSPSPAACGPCTASTISVVLPLPSPTPTPSPTLTPTPTPEPYAAYVVDDLEESLMLAAALMPEGRACLASGGTLSPDDLVVRTEDRAQLDVRCDCGGAP